MRTLTLNFLQLRVRIFGASIKLNSALSSYRQMRTKLKEGLL